MDADKYKEAVKAARLRFISPFDLAYKAFEDLGYDKQPKDFFFNNASEYVLKMRKQCWNEFLPYEKQFTQDMLEMLIDHQAIEKMKPSDAIKHFVAENTTQIYDLTLSNTQSRRARAGKEFEAILELLLMGADIPTDTQGQVGKTVFAAHGLGKLVDFVVPGVTQYGIDKRDTILISAKTTLRERWQEVPEEMTRTGSREMYLATLDEGITDETIRVLYEANVYIVTTKGNKEKYYSHNEHVLTFENMLNIARNNCRHWENKQKTQQMIMNIRARYSAKLSHHKGQKYIAAYYIRKLNELLAK